MSVLVHHLLLWRSLVLLLLLLVVGLTPFGQPRLKICKGVLVRTLFSFASACPLKA
jgi:hypothetical protein